MLHPLRLIIFAVAVAALIGAAFCFMASSAVAQPVCNDRQKFLDHLSSKYDEAPVSMGLASNGAVLEVLASRKTGSWTIIITGPTGQSCVIATGEGWENITVSLSDPDA